MSVTIKSAEEIELMRQAGKYLAKVHQELERAIKPGISTWEIDKIGEETIRSLGYPKLRMRTIVPELSGLSGIRLCIGQRRSCSWNSKKRPYY